MTDQEKRLQKAHLVIEYQEAEDTLSALRERASKLSVLICDVGLWLKGIGAPHHHFRPDISAATMSMDTDQASHREAFDFDAIIALTEQIRFAQSKLSELAERKAALGLK